MWRTVSPDHHDPDRGRLRGAYLDDPKRGRPFHDPCPSSHDGSNQSVDAAIHNPSAISWYSESFIASAEYNAPGPDTRFEELIEEIRGTKDVGELQRLAAEAMSELVDEEVAAVPLAGTYRIYALHEDLQGFEPHPSGTHQRWHTTYWGQ